jgi:hypothetical protein
MADYWPKEDGDDLWCSVDTIVSQSGLSRATTYRALASLQTDGWLRQTEPARGNRSPRYAPTLPEGSHHETPEVAQGDPQQSHRETRHETHSTQNSGRGSDDPWATAPRAAGKPAAVEKAIPPKTPEQRRIDRMQADYQRLRAICREIGQDAPINVYWTLKHEHQVLHPDSFLRDLVMTGQWDGFVGRHGISAYHPDGTPA